MTPVEHAVRQVEDRIRSNPFESAYAFDQRGNLVFAKAGDPNTPHEVTFTAAEMAQLQNTVLTHNHPAALQWPGTDPRSQGDSFSPEDLDVVTNGQVAEIRAVSPIWRYSMKRPTGGWDRHYFTTKLKPAFLRHEADVVVELGPAVVHGAITRAEFEAGYLHEIWTRVASELGLEYSREP